MFRKIQSIPPLWSNTGKQQFTANQSIYQLSDKDRVFRMILICDVVFGLIYNVLGVKSQSQHLHRHSKNNKPAH